MREIYPTNKLRRSLLLGAQKDCQRRQATTDRRSPARNCALEHPSFTLRPGIVHRSLLLRHVPARSVGIAAHIATILIVTRLFPPWHNPQRWAPFSTK